MIMIINDLINQIFWLKVCMFSFLKHYMGIFGYNLWSIVIV